MSHQESLGVTRGHQESPGVTRKGLYMVSQCSPGIRSAILTIHRVALQLHLTMPQPNTSQRARQNYYLHRIRSARHIVHFNYISGRGLKAFKWYAHLSQTTCWS